MCGSQISVDFLYTAFTFYGCLLYPCLRIHTYVPTYATDKKFPYLHFHLSPFSKLWKSDPDSDQIKFSAKIFTLISCA